MKKILLVIVRAYAHGLFIQGRRLSEQAKKHKGLKRQELRIQQNELAKQTRIANLANAFLREISYSKLEKKTLDVKQRLAKDVALFLENLNAQSSGWYNHNSYVLHPRLQNDILSWMLKSEVQS